MRSMVVGAAARLKSDMARIGELWKGSGCVSAPSTASRSPSPASG